ncbi:hypothetical protein [Couchioplanes caeruleus]|uniref:Uncharacterized protein n=2 Tax=Couchioplanes caeruleus TaxID=56438 RepID=A0A1K0GLZ9_9ACTN|nr:hypothetical protein [Couchioplanes caeruleus]OJF10203.1 hypothetical protein BG844_33290 [Couchioplanes caeruleus subsp. caeruleus]ROP28833.1 hypothetical protein EDD30_1610 [Couchioplanes caeruleus]
MSNDILERRYRALLRSYPAGYRRERTDELLEILVSDVSATRRWPEWRQAVALVRGGLRVRAGSTAERPTAVLFWQGMQLAAMAVLALGALIGLDDAVEPLELGGLDSLPAVLVDHGPNLLLILAALAALILGRQGPAAGLVVAAIVVPTAVSVHLFANSLPQWWAPVVAASLVIAGLRRPADVPPVERGNAVVVTLGVLVLHLMPVGRLTMVDPVQRSLAAIAVVAVMAAFLWVASADQRMLLAAAPTFLLVTLHQVTTDPASMMSFYPAEGLPSVIVGVAMVAAATVATWRRHARA